MTRQEIATMIAGLKLPYAYYQFPEGTAEACPFICFYYPESADFLADNLNYVHATALVIELYTDNVDFDLQQAVMEMLEDNDLVYTWTETWIDSERMHMTTFYTEVLINAE